MAEKLDDGAMRLRTGNSVWQAGDERAGPGRSRDPRKLETDIIIVGAGITGAFLAERFTRTGRRVVLIDRREAVTGSTAASTALLLWELDAPLIEIEDRLGVEKAKIIAATCRRAVPDIGGLVNQLGIPCGLDPAPSLYMAGDKLDTVDIREEQRLREALGIESRFLDADALGARGWIGEGALLSPGSAEVDPVGLARGLLAIAEARGAVRLSPATASVYHAALDGVHVETREGDVARGALLVLANGYEMPGFVPAARHKLKSSWALATAPAPNGDGGPLMWEASDPYLCMRRTSDGRIIAGGEDEAFAEAEVREARTGEKARAILDKLVARCPKLAGLEVEFAWSGVFGETEDALPMIGRVPGTVNCLSAFGYGGNGITFSAIAADVLQAELEGAKHPAADLFALDRD